MKTSTIDAPTWHRHTLWRVLPSLATIVGITLQLASTHSWGIAESVQPANGSPQWSVQDWDTWSCPDCSTRAPKPPTPDTACRYWLDSPVSSTNAAKNGAMYDYLGVSMLADGVAHCLLKYRHIDIQTYTWAYDFGPKIICPMATPPYTFKPLTGMCERDIPCLPPNVFDPVSKRCITEEYEIKLTGNTQTEPSQPLSYVATVIDKATQQPPTKAAAIKISLTVDATSGGHDHGDSTRPRGSLNGVACETDDTCITLTAVAGSGTAPFTFTPRDASGKHTITASCDKCSSGDSKTVEVKVEGLKPIPASTFFVFGPSSRHGTKNHYLMPAAAEKLLLLAINYQSQGQFKIMDPSTNTMVWPEPFRVNDASLELGGLFDIYGDWTNPHKEHRRGTTVDLRANEGTPNAIPPENFEGFEMLLTNINGGEEGGFIRECTKDKKDTNGNLIPPIHKRMASNYCVSQLDGSFDDNRHYHVRLMGVAE